MKFQNKQHCVEDPSVLDWTLHSAEYLEMLGEAIKIKMMIKRLQDQDKDHISYLVDIQILNKNSVQAGVLGIPILLFFAVHWHLQIQLTPTPLDWVRTRL